MKIEFDYKFGQSLYLKNDPEQAEYLLNRIIICAKGVIWFEIFGGNNDYIEVPESFTTKERDILKIAGVENKEDE